SEECWDAGDIHDLAMTTDAGADRGALSSSHWVTDRSRVGRSTIGGGCGGTASDGRGGFSSNHLVTNRGKEGDPTNGGVFSQCSTGVSAEGGCDFGGAGAGAGGDAGGVGGLGCGGKAGDAGDSAGGGGDVVAAGGVGGGGAGKSTVWVARTRRTAAAIAREESVAPVTPRIAPRSDSSASRPRPLNWSSQRSFGRNS